MEKILLLLALILSTSLLASLERVSVQLEWKHQFEFAGFYAAIEKGYYRDVGLDVELKEFQDGIDISDDVIKQKSTFGVSSSSLILDRLRNKPIVLIASYFKQNALMLAVKPGIDSVSDLKNKKIMALPYEIEHTSLGVMLKDNKLNKNDYTLVNHSYKIDEFANGKVDAMSIFVTNQPYLLDKSNVKYNIINPADYGIYSYDLELFTSEKIVKKNPQMIEKFVEATNKGWEYAFRNKEEIVDLIYSKFTTSKSKEALLYEAIKTEQLFKTNIFKIGAVVPELVKLNAQIYSKLSFLKDSGNTSELLSNYLFDNLKESNREQTFQELKLINENRTILTQQEKEYLREKKQITACIDPDWMPFESFKDGKHIGLTADYFKKFQSSISIPITVIKTETWMQSLDYAKQRKCDILSFVMETPERKKYLNFTTPYFKTPLVIATKPDIPFIADLKNIVDKKIGIPVGYASRELLRNKYPNLHLVDVDNMRDGLKKVNNGELFGFIGTLATIGYLFQTEFTSELKIAGKFDESWELGIGVRNDDPVLLNILEKAVNSVSESDRQDILNKWISINYENGIDYTLVWQISLMTILIILGTTYWIRRLSLLNRELENAKIKAEEATQMKSNFLANMSHEIRTPMNSIVSMTYLIKKKIVDAQQIQYINMIETASNSLLMLINDILDLSKIEAKKLDINNKNFNLIELLDDVNNVTKIKADEKGLTFKIIYDKADCISVYGDSLRLAQIISNLTSNAVKFTSSGYITLHVKQISKNMYRFSVSDTGIGLTEEQINKLFSPFMQADESITRKYGGTGLGLSICKELVELMNGRIWIESSINKGSSFIFEVELKESDIVVNNKANSAQSNPIAKSKLNKKVLSDEKKKALFSKLDSAISSRRPNICEPIISEIDTYTLNEEDEELFENVKKLVNKYRFQEAKELLNAN